MPTTQSPSATDAATIARLIIAADERNRAEIVHRLRRQVRLSRTVHELNRMLDQPDQRPLGMAALRCLGLERAG